jgi:hypothetical protein
MDLDFSTPEFGYQLKVFLEFQPTKAGFSWVQDGNH